MGLLITSESVGLTSAPIIGSFLYSLGGYEYPFYVVGAMFGISAIVSYFLIPSSVDREATSAPKQDSNRLDEIDEETHSHLADSQLIDTNVLREVGQSLEEYKEPEEHKPLIRKVPKKEPLNLKDLMRDA